jgi:isopentenyldiphosphate isomerase
MDPGDEMVMIVDERNLPIGAEKRSNMRLMKRFHRAVYILVFNSRGKLFRHKRTATKDIYPGYYDVAAGGVVLAHESVEAAAARELEEELGIKDAVLSPLSNFYYEDAGNRVFGKAYACMFDGALRLQKEEIESGGFYSIGEIFSSMDKEPYTPDGIYVLKRYLEEKTARLVSRPDTLS